MESEEGRRRRGSFQISADGNCCCISTYLYLGPELSMHGRWPGSTTNEWHTAYSGNTAQGREGQSRGRTAKDGRCCLGGKLYCAGFYIYKEKGKKKKKKTLRKASDLQLNLVAAQGSRRTHRRLALVASRLKERLLDAARESV